MEANIELIESWFDAKQKLTHYKELELALRKKIHNEIFNQTEMEGTHLQNLGHGYVMELTIKNNYKVDSIESAEVVLAQIPQQNHDVFNWSVDLSLSAYKELPLKIQNIVDSCITFKPGMPTIEIKKGSRWLQKLF